VGNSLIKTISIPIFWEKWLEENPDISLSKVCQAKLIEIKENRSGLLERNEKLRAIISRQSDEIKNLEQKLDEKSE